MSLSGMSHSGPWTDCRSTIVVLSQYSVHAQYCVAHQLVALLTLRVEAYSRGTASWRARSPLTAALQFSTPVMFVQKIAATQAQFEAGDRLGVKRMDSHESYTLSSYLVCRGRSKR